MAAHRAGIVAVVGKPNVGKSTLVNTLVGQKVSIVSDKAQTTRRRILGILTHPDAQIIFADTPGLHTAKHKLGSVLNEAVRASVDGVDLLLAVFDVSRRPGKEDLELVRLIKESAGSTPVLVCLNKMDKLKAENVEANYEAYCELFPLANVMMTSFSRFQNVDKLLELLKAAMPEGDALYPEDEFTDQPARFLCAELVREKALRLTKQEVPHAVATSVEAWEEKRGLTKISVVVLVESDGQKAILIGKGGAMLKRIGTEARVEIEELLDTKVFLEIFVKVRANWRQNTAILREFDLL